MAVLYKGDSPAQKLPAPGGPLGPTGFRRVLAYVRTPRRPVLMAELLLIGVTYWVYSMIRNAVPDHQAGAVERGFELWRFQQQNLNIDIEMWINQTIHGVEWLVIAMNYFYATMHFVVTAAVLVWLYRCHPGRYRASRTVLAITTCLALFGYFLYPLAPPRLLPGTGFVDTIRVHETWGSVTSGDMQELSNQYAAMPSMHAGWSMWCGIIIVMFARRRWTQILGALYPLTTLVVIMATANHFVLDAVGGWLTLGAGFLLQWVLYGRPAYAFAREVATVT
ncbi:phosphatase PAP2 family protein [Phytoactinopolyspora endophytica]|uniref:phosphatase PAP2 family protein n=1 Tax=Phytoactinopolyspora endophytica TaxID=1642495 RepID=UPI00197C1881|nr:phosphatase PAP2 family protein [Phytoactinopolyspora endophytica]